MSNEQGVFEREKDLCKLFLEKKENNIYSMAYDFSNEGLVMRIYFDKEDHWC